MNAILIIATLVILALLILAIVKKFDIALALLMLSTIGYLFYTVVTGNSVMGDNTCGNKFFDVFMQLESIFQAQMAGNVLLLMSVFAFVAYMNHIKATNLLCLVLGKPLSKVKAKYAVLCGVMVITIFLKFVIFSNMGQMALVVATLFPILLALGLSRETAASGILFATAIAWGPANGMTAVLFSLGDVGDWTIPTYFAKYEIPNIAISVSVALIVFYFSSKYFDRKENAACGAGVDFNIDPKSLGLPLWYAVLPILPVILVVVFSPLVVGSISISITAASLLSYLLSCVLEFIRNKDKKQALEDTKEFWKGCGQMMASIGGLIICAGIFANCMSMLGGLKIIFSGLISGGGSVTTVIILASLAAFLFTMLSASGQGSIALFGAILAQVSEAAGSNYIAAVRCLMPVCMVANAVSPTVASNYYLATATGVAHPTLLKRAAPPVIAFVISTILVTQFLFPC